MRNGMKRPHEFPSDHVVSTKIAWRGQIAFTGCRPQHDQIFEDASRGIGLNADDGVRISTETLPQIHEPVVAKCQNRLAASGLDFLEEIIDREDEAPIVAVFALPVRNSARRQAWKVFVNPDFLSRGGV